MKFFRQITDGLSEIIYPNHCQVCGDGLKGDEKFVCISCNYEMPFLSDNKFKYNHLKNLFDGRIEIESVYSLFEYSRDNQVSELLKGIKYHGKTKMAAHYGSLLGAQIAKGEIDYIVPIPLHKKKQRQRGYNQSTAIAKGIQQSLQKPLREKLLKRRVHNPSQTKFSKYDRWSNVRSIFELSQNEDLNGKHILIVDDVLTTGATIESSAAEFLQNANCKISVATLAARV